MHSRQTLCQLNIAACARSLTVSVKWETGVSSVDRGHPLKGDSNSDWGKTIRDPVVPGTRKHTHCSAALNQTHGPSLSYGKEMSPFLSSHDPRQYPYSRSTWFLLNPHPSWAGHLASALVELGEAKLLSITQMYPGLAL